ncbi:MAG: hypothetical protein KJ904_14815 [Alphaproteobacteria bacterium]|nr:hypothetical protein [Alphaproteobacteria bacterium]MBU0798468.1 hypothetical protein [Alphaproteobacteria bacterium]MBU0888426.1 hypothetical protein [Alphaproteobacteria bacterium]MBU1814737.1 hypothetical protein [Alphaproteobacteria bacterium]
MTKPEKLVLIDLTQDEIDLTQGELQRLGGSRLRTLINDQVKAAAESTYDKVKPTDITYSRPHRAILIEGGRGSGKTTFLLGNMKRLHTPENQNGTKADAFEGKIHVLPMVDPTLIEAKDNVIIVIVQMIEEAIDAIGGRDRHDDGARDQLDKAREGLAEGLSMLDGIGQNEPYGSQWEDAYWVMSEGLRKAKKGRSFELKFNRYLEQALKILGKQAFVLAFDDVDTNFRHGHVILETIRKYLTSPRLILILSGDLDLYGRLIREHIYKTFGENILKYDARVTKVGGQTVQTAVRELEEQYLLKILPPENRIRMLPLGGLAHARSIQVRSGRPGTKTDTTNAESALPRWISRRVSAILGEWGTTEHPFVQVIWREHLRLVLGYLRALDLAINENAPTGVASPEIDDLAASRSMVLKVFETRLRMAGVPTDLFDTEIFDMTLKLAFDWLSNQDEPATLVRFGTPGDSNQAIVLHCLALAIAQGLNKSGHGLKALLTVVLPAVMLKRPLLAGADRKKDVFAYLWGQAVPFLPETAARISAIDRYQQDQTVGKSRASSFGSVGLAGKDSGSLSREAAIERVYGILFPVKDQEGKKKISDLENKLENNKKTNRSSRRWLNLMSSDDKKGLDAQFGAGWFTVENVLERERCGEFGTILSLIFFKRYSERGETFRSISALSLLAVIAELLLRNNLPGLNALSADTIIPAFGSATVVEKRTDAEMQDGLADDEEQETNSTTTDQASVAGETSLEQGSYSEFLGNMKKWHDFAKDLEKNVTLSPSLLGALGTRIHDDLWDLDQTITGSWGSGDILHRQITNILNAIIAVTSGGQGRKESPKQSDVPLINALRKTGNELHPLAVILLSCPLVWVFLQPANSASQKDNASENELVDEVRRVLKAWHKSSSSVEKLGVGAFDRWTKAPEIEVKISKIAKTGDQRKVTVNGFFDLLNVVPRYADDAK